MMTVTDVTKADERRAWKNADFRHLWRGSAVSSLGSEIAEIAVPLFAIVTLAASAAQVSVLRIVQFLPFLVATLPAGFMIDKWWRARLRWMIGTDVARAMLIGVVPLAFWAGFADINILYAVVFTVALFTVVYQVADFAVLPAIVSPAQLVDANGKLSATQSGSEIAGRGLGGLLVQLLSAPVALLLNAFGYLISALSLSRIRYAPSPDAAAPESGSSWREAMRGVALTLRHPYLRPLLAEATTFNLANEVFLLGLMLYVVREAGLGPIAIGVMFTAGGVGSFLGAWFGARMAGRFGYGRVLIITLAAGNGAPLGAMLAERAGSALMPLLCAVFAVMGVGIGIANMHAVSLRQAAVAENVRGRVNAAYRLISWGAIPAGAAAGGLIATHTSPFTAVCAGAVGISCATLWVAFSRIPRLRSIEQAVT
jgi:MFS family permease